MAGTAATQAVVTAETPAIMAWATRSTWEVDLDLGALVLNAGTVHPVARTNVVFHAELEEYPVLPPAWTCRDADGAIAPSVFPLAGSRPGVSGSIFHGNKLICAPWNRLAYAVHGGPHSDWTELTVWKTIPGNVTQAHTLADMLATISIHLAASPGTTVA
jgi:hypothetical protein